MNSDDYLETETYRKTATYYERNKAYFNPLDRNAEKQPMIFKYLINHETIHPIENLNRYPFFMKLFDRLSGDRRSATEEDINQVALVAQEQILFKQDKPGTVLVSSTM